MASQGVDSGVTLPGGATSSVFMTTTSVSATRPPYFVAMMRSHVWLTVSSVTIGEYFVAILIICVATGRDIVATWRGRRATQTEGVTFPHVQELPEGERLPGKTGNVATSTLPAEGEGVQEWGRVGIVTDGAIVVTLCTMPLKWLGVFVTAKGHPVTKRGGKPRTVGALSAGAVKLTASRPAPARSGAAAPSRSPRTSSRRASRLLP